MAERFPIDEKTIWSVVCVRATNSRIDSPLKRARLDFRPKILCPSSDPAKSISSNGLPLALLVNLLGGPSANSLLNVLVREKNGLSYNIEASYTPYSDSGIVAIYFSCDHDNTDHCIELIEGELGRLRNTPLSARRLSMAKKQFIAQLAISMESNEGYMLGAGKSFLAHREVDTMEEVYRKIQALTAEDLTAVASSVFSSPSRLIYK